MDPSRRHFLARASAAGLAFPGLQAMCARLSSASPLARWNQLSDGYGPLVPDPHRIVDLPSGFSYSVVSRTGDVMDDGLFVAGQPDGMATFPGPDGHTLIVRNHEIEDANSTIGPFGANNELLKNVDRSLVFDDGGGMTPRRGGTSTVLYDTRAGRVVRQYQSLAGTERNCAGGPTPRGTWLTCEEAVDRANAHLGGPFHKDHGWIFEVPARAEIGLTKPVPLTAMGRFYREACATDPATGIVYMTEDRPDGLLYRFIPDVPDRLVEGGKVQALAITGRKGFDTRNWEEASGVRVGERLGVSWIDLDQVDAPNDELRYRGYAMGAARFARGEGMWYGRGVVYFTCTNGGITENGQIWKLTPPARAADGREGPGFLELFIEPNDAGVVENADNVTVAPWGDLVVCEDAVRIAGETEQFLFGVTPEGRVYKLAKNAWNESELSGVCFSPDGSTMFVNIQHNPGMTLAVRGPWRKM